MNLKKKTLVVAWAHH